MDSIDSGATGNSSLGVAILIALASCLQEVVPNHLA